MNKTSTIANALSLILIVLTLGSIALGLCFSQLPVSEVANETELLNTRELTHFISHTNKKSGTALRSKKKQDVFFLQLYAEKVISQPFSHINSVCIRHCTFLI